MTFMAMLVKEMRLRMRRERTIWTLVLYVLLLGLLAWFMLDRSYASAPRINQWSSIGYGLYHLLTAVQVLLILFITPAFTATAINGEKERQTYEMLICSRLSSFSLVTGKLIAGVSGSLLLIAASIPLFSLVFFLGGVAPLTILWDLLTFVITVVMVATLGFLCSVLLPRPAISTAVVYMVVLLWLMMPIMFQYLVPTTSSSVVYSTNVVGSMPYVKNGIAVIQVTGGSGITQTPTLPLISAWNPLIALNDTFFLPFAPSTILYALNGVQQGSLNYSIMGLVLTPQEAYAALSVFATVFFFGLSLCFAKPLPMSRIRAISIPNRSEELLQPQTSATGSLGQGRATAPTRGFGKILSFPTTFVGYTLKLKDTVRIQYGEWTIRRRKGPE